MKTFLINISLLSAIFLSGCATHNKEMKIAKDAWQMGDVAIAEQNLLELNADKEGSADDLVFDLELATASRANCNFDTSIKYFDQADVAFQYYENQADIQLLNESKAIFTNQSYLPYKGYSYDKIMASVYQALNFIELKKFDDAAVLLKKLENYQKTALFKNQDRIEKQNQALYKANHSNKNANYDISKSINSSVNSQLTRLYGNDYMNSSRQMVKGLYVNPFAYWLTGLYFSNKAVDSADKSLASDMFRLGGEMLGNQSTVFAQDFKMAEDLRNGLIQKPKNLTYVIYETGLAPNREQHKLTIPILLPKGYTQVGLNFPYLKNNDLYQPNLDIKAGGKNINLETIVCMDDIIKEEFNQELPYIITKTIISSAVKAVAQYYMTESNVYAGIGMAIYNLAMNDADLRTWITLPKQIKVARFETPADSKVYINGNLVNLNPYEVNVVLVKKMSLNSKLIIRNFDFSNNIPTYAKKIIKKETKD